MDSKKVVPEPVYPPGSPSSSGSDDNIDSDSTETDIYTEPSDHDNDVIMGDAEDAQSGKQNIPTDMASHPSTEEQKTLRLFNSLHDAAEEMDILGVQDEKEDEDMDKGDQIETEMYAYPDPRTSEMVPPPTLRLSHMKLPLPSIKTNTSKNDTKELPGAVMEESEDGDLSNVIHLMPTNGERPLFPMDVVSYNTSDHKRDTTMQDHEDEDRALPNTINADVSDSSTEVDTSDIITSNSTDALRQESKVDLSDIPHRVSEQPWWPEVQKTLRTEGRFKTRTPLPGLNHTPGLGRVAVHRDGSTKTPMTEMRGKLFAEQPRAIEPTIPTTSTAYSEPEELPDRALTIFMGDMEKMEEEVLTKFYAEEKLRCRAHNQLHSEHTDPYLFMRRCRRPLEDEEIREIRPYCAEGIQNIRKYRFNLPKWKKYAVWNRTFLSTEIRLTPLQDESGKYRTCLKFHMGRGPTGGDPSETFWRHCNPYGDGCEAC
jgi:hypothetical protein